MYHASRAQVIMDLTYASLACVAVTEVALLKQGWLEGATAVRVVLMRVRACLAVSACVRVPMC